jgi:hypothetical protein
MSLRSDINKYTPRKEQTDALEFVKETWTENAKIKFFLLDLPVGVGKSHLAMMLADWYSRANNGTKIDIITAGKILQDQYDISYESINNLKGKENYDCNQYACSCANGKEFNRLNKTSCDSCPYDGARNGYISGKVSLTNFHLYLTYALYNQNIVEGRESTMLIVDECLHPDTEITLHDFSKKRISDVNIGDLVWTINESNGELEIKEVEFVYKNLNKGQQMYELEMDNGDIIQITGNHKVKLKSGIWKKVEDLSIEDEIIDIYYKTECHEIDNNGKR